MKDLVLFARDAAEKLNRIADALEMLEDVPSTEKSKVKAKPAAKAKAKVVVPAVEETLQDEVRSLAKKAMGQGVERALIKKKITALGAESIADLDDEALEKLKSFLDEQVR